MNGTIVSMLTIIPEKSVSAMSYEIKASCAVAAELENAVTYIAERFAALRATRDALHAHRQIPSN